MPKNVTPLTTRSSSLVVPPREAARLLSIGTTRLYELIGANALQSYHCGRARKILTSSIGDYIIRQLAAEGATKVATRG
jgi:excisionase family DNA binding protein